MKEVVIPENILKKQHSDRIDNYSQGQTENIYGPKLYLQAQEDKQNINDTKEFPAQKKRGRWQGLIVGIAIGVI
ncbi:hypothetical protein, partial [Dapis sp. BLCC M229]|uniref:hypothetical protein n=1 Tax=Dapis sp. BLCC M229 TaxID=3400188 RepID=UPI003CFB31C6